MKLNTSWLQRYLDRPIPHRDLIEAMPRAGLEVEAESELAVALRDVRIGFVRDKTPAGPLGEMWAAKVELDRGQIVTVLVGNEHPVEIGWGVPVAPVGTTLPTGKRVTAGRFHGIDSQGMVCLDGELGRVADDTGMRWWTDASLLGRAYTDVVDVDDYLIELKVLPNRPDCLGVLGIARELAALFGCHVVRPTLRLRPAARVEVVPVTIESVDLCRRFTAAAVRNVAVGPSPAWLKSVLLTAGMRPINNVVDVTNFVMWETGQPLHAFDLNNLAGHQITVRRLRAGETLTLLSGKTISAKYGEPLCVCDANGPQALAGVMGGATAETTAATTDVLLEAAYFDPVHVRKNVKAVRNRQGSGSDSSYRFERGVDPNAMLDIARWRACALMIELTGGHVDGTPTDVYPNPVVPRQFDLSAEKVSRLLGTPVTPQRIATALRPLGYDVSPELRVTVPTFRVDANDPVVLAEDVARMIGYDNIAAAETPIRATRGQASLADRLRTAAGRAMVDFGWLETKNDPLEAETRANAWLGGPPDAIVLSNAATAEMNTLRRTLITGLAASAQRNVFRGVSSVRLFEIDRTFATLPGRWTLGGICGGDTGRPAWRPAKPLDFFDLKGVLEDLFEALGLRGVGFVATHTPPATAAASAAITFGGETVGWVGELDPKLVKIERAGFKIFAFEIDLDALEPRFGFPPGYVPLNKLPAVVRDLAFVLPSDVAYARIEQTVRSSGGAMLETVSLADVYTGTPVPAGKRSLALRLTYRDAVRTLTTEEVTAAVDAIAARMLVDFGATLRA